MPPRRKASGLTDEEVSRLRDQLAEGRRPRVALSGPQFEAGASGSVIRIGDPAVDGADFLTVRVKVNGVTDELAFAPSELSTGRPRATAPAGKPSRASAPRTRRTPAPSGAGSSGVGSSGAVSAGTGSGSVPAETVASGTASSGIARSGTAPSGPAPAAPAPSGTAPAGPAPSAPSRTASAKKAVAQPSAPAATTSTPAGSSAGRRRKAPAAPTVSVTISSSGAAWSVSASRGARTILKNAPVTPGLVTALADLIDQPGVSEAVAEINEAARQQAQERAEQLRAELSDLEAVLATHRSPR
ncbi:MAG: hypothetical protein JO144_11450 [Actinobacteria bacterium]|nr:hypothetical protein [Actinomycetota bacterium]